MAMILPKYVNFNGDNGKYLKRYYDRADYMQFSVSEIGADLSTLEIFPATDGNIRLKCIENNRFLKVENDYVRAISNDWSNNDRATLFRPIQVDDTTIALMSVGNNKFCKRYTTSIHHCLSAIANTVEVYAKLKVVEPVLSRQIYGLVYDLANTKIYGETMITLGNGFLINKSYQSVTMTSEVTYEDIKTCIWKSTLSLKSNVTATTEAGVPLIGDDAKVKVSPEIKEHIEWGNKETTKTSKKLQATILVPPSSKGTINLVAKHGTCDVTFTYKQKDVLYNGSTVVTEISGTYTGSNIYGTTFEVPEFEPLK